MMSMHKIFLLQYKTSHVEKITNIWRITLELNIILLNLLMNSIENVSQELDYLHITLTLRQADTDMKVGQTDDVHCVTLTT